MKKSLVAVSVIMVLGAAWSGASWYTGKLIEQHMGEIVDNANGQLKAYLPKAGMKLGYENYQRGIFSSKIRYVLRADGRVTTDDALLKPGDEVAFQETIDHGPFPFAQLKKFNLLPSLASVHTELENGPMMLPSLASAHAKLKNPPLIKNLFDITKGKSPFSAESRISYSGDTSTVIDVIPLDYQKDKSTLKFSGATINADVSRDMKTITVEASSDSAVFSGPNQFGQIEQVQLLGASLKSQTHTGQFGLRLGNQNLQLRQVQVNVNGIAPLLLEGFKLATQIDEKGTDLNGQFDYTLDALKVKNIDFGSGKLTLIFDKLDAKSLKVSADNYNRQAMAVLQQAQKQNMEPVGYQLQITAFLLQNLPLLLKSNPSISIAPLSWKNSKGESTLTMKMDLTAPTQAGSPPESPEQLVASAIKKVDFNLSMPVAMVTETAQRLDANSAAVHKVTQEEIRAILATPAMSAMTTLKDDVIGINIHYADNQIDLNGKKMTLQKFVGLLGSPAR